MSTRCSPSWPHNRTTIEVTAAGLLSVHSTPSYPLTTSNASCHSSVSLSNLVSGSSGSSRP
ncbi:Uncharacterised protein [Mycobacterium tuberculosis]|nr:Uncharacterised protein [Mycobacterium tuberculosis]CPC00687.1 Uncharacterised protein [Mycobacterium tuberculosis]